MNSSLQQAAAKMRQLRQAGVVGDGNGFNYVPEVADYMAWFCPEKRFFDRLYSLFPHVAGELRRYAFRLRSCSRKVQSAAEASQKELQLQRTWRKKNVQNTILIM